MIVWTNSWVGDAPLGQTYVNGIDTLSLSSYRAPDESTIACSSQPVEPDDMYCTTVAILCDVLVD